MKEEAAEKKRLEEEADEKNRRGQEEAEKRRMELAELRKNAEKRRLEEERAEKKKKRLEEEAAEEKRIAQEDPEAYKKRHEWYYIDDLGFKQGPFPVTEMREWYYKTFNIKLRAIKLKIKPSILTEYEIRN